MTTERIAANVAAAADTFPQSGLVAAPCNCQGVLAAGCGARPCPVHAPSPIFTAMSAADARIAAVDRAVTLMGQAIAQLIVFRALLGEGDRRRDVDALIPELRSVVAELVSPGSVRVPTPVGEVWELLYHTQDDRDEALTRVQELEAEVAELRAQQQGVET